MKTSSPDPDRRSTDDLERLLALAEHLQELCERSERKIQTCRLLQMLMLAIFSIVLVILLAKGPPSGGMDLSQLVFVTAEIALLLYLLALEWAIRMIKRRAFPDKVALHKLLELARETEAAAAKAQGWSALDRAQFQIRLSRLVIQP